MSSAASSLVSKVWNYCNLLRDDGVSYCDYVEQLTYLLFLKMDYERTRPPYNRKSSIPEEYNWASLIEPVSSSISSTRNRGALSAPMSRVTSTKACSKRTRRIPNPAPASTSLAVLAAEIVEDLQAALDQFAQIAADRRRSQTSANSSNALYRH